MKIDAVDHLVLTVKDIEATCAFYGKALECRWWLSAKAARRWPSDRRNKPAPARTRIRAQGGSSDARLRRHLPDHVGRLAEVIAHLNACEVEIIEGR